MTVFRRPGLEDPVRFSTRYDRNTLFLLKGVVTTRWLLIQGRKERKCERKKEKGEKESGEGLAAGLYRNGE